MKSRKIVIEAPGKPRDLKFVSTISNIPIEDEPLPSERHLRLRVIASTSTYTDILILAGNYATRFPYPLTPGYDAIGEVIKMGREVKDFEIGDIVACLPQHGGCQDYLDWPFDNVVKLNRTVDPLKAASLLLTGVAAHQMIHRLAFPSGSSKQITENTKVLIHSCAGGTGSMMVRLARVAGIPKENIYGTCRSEHFQYANDSGCGHPIDYQGTDWSVELKDVRFDAIFDAIGGEYYEKSLSLLNENGTYVWYGFTSSSDPGSFPTMSVLLQFTAMFFRNAFVSWIDGKNAVFYNIMSMKEQYPQSYVDDLHTLLQLVEDGRLEVPITEIITLDQVPKALQQIADMKHHGKIVVAVDNKLSEVLESQESS